MQGFSSHTKPTRVIENKTTKKKRERASVYVLFVLLWDIIVFISTEGWRHEEGRSNSAAAAAGVVREGNTKVTPLLLHCYGTWNWIKWSITALGGKGEFQWRVCGKKCSFISCSHQSGWRQKKTKQWTIRSWGSFLISRCGLAPL